MRIKIGGHNYKVEVVAENDLSETDCGKIDRRLNKIFINANLEESQKDVTLIHEILHAMNNELPKNLVDGLAEQIYAFLVDNKYKKPWRK